MEQSNKFNEKINKINTIMLQYLMCAITFCLIIATISATKLIIVSVVTPNILDIDSKLLLAEIFSIVLYILIGYDLFIALHIVVTSQIIPVLPIIRIAMIALANKIIALNLLVDDYRIILGLAAFLISLAVATFFLRIKDKRLDLNVDSNLDSWRNSKDKS